MLLRCAAVVALLAGCMQAPADEDPPAGVGPHAAQPAAFEVDVDHADCHGIEVFASAPAGDLRSYVPDDFEVPDNPLVAFGAFRCGEEGAVVGRAFLAIQVVPRHDALRSARAENYFWEPEHYLAPDGAITAAFNATGAAWAAAEVAASVSPTSSAFRTASANRTYTFSAAATGPDGTFHLASQLLRPFREYMAADGGYAYLDAAFGGGAGVTGLAAGTMAAVGEGPTMDIYGPSSTRPAILASQLAYTDAVVGFVPVPQG